MKLKRLMKIYIIGLGQVYNSVGRVVALQAIGHRFESG